MDRIDLMLARAQIWLASLMAAGFLSVIFVLIFYHDVLDDTSKTLLTGLVGVLGTIVTQQSGYFFARSRPTSSIDSAGSPPVPTTSAQPTKP